MSPYSSQPARSRTLAGLTAVVLFAIASCSSQSTGSTTTSTGSSGTDAPPPASTGAGPSSTGSAGASTFTWTDCGDGFQCSSLTVPEDWAKPDGRTIDISVSRLPATAAQSEGVLLINWGGPGAPGVQELRTYGRELVDATQGRLDLVSWDPRGLATSTPIECPEGNDAFYWADPSTDAGFAAMAKAARDKAAACSQRYGDYIGLVGTTQGVRDLDAIRAALGEEKINFLGHSYGTRVGSVYAAMFPDRIRTMVLDGSLTPWATLRSTALGNAISFEEALHEWFRRCTAAPPCAFGEDPAAGFDALVAQVRADPPAVPGTNDRLTVGLLNQVFLAGIVNYNGSTDVANQAIAELRAGDPSTAYLLGTAAAGRKPDGTFNNASAIFQFVNCQDWSDRPSEDEVKGAMALAQQSAPRLGEFAVAFSYLNSLGCPNPPESTPVPSSTDLPPTMIIGGANDSETPLQWSQELSAAMPNSQLLVSQDWGHTAFYTSACVAERAGAYLVSGELPPPGTVCPAD